MKNILLILVLLLSMVGRIYGQAPKWGYGDTIDGVNGMDSTYFTNFDFENWFNSTPRTNVAVVSNPSPHEAYFSSDLNPTSNAWYSDLNRGADSIARFFYTDRPIKIVGIAISVAYYSLEDYTYNTFRSDTMNCQASLFLYDAIGDSLAFKEEVPMPPNLSMPHRYMRLPSDPAVAPPCMGGFYAEDSIMPLYETYFPNPVTVYDSFYVGFSCCTKQGEDFRWDPPFLARVSEMYEGDDDKLCQYILPNFRYRVVRSTIMSNWTQFVEYWSIPRLFMIFPLIELDTECTAVNSVEVSETDSGRVRLVWEMQEGHTWWEVSYGPAGIEADSGTVIACSDTTAVLEGIADGERYWAYVRAICVMYNDTNYSDWSDPVEIYNPIRHTVVAEANYEERGRVEGGGVYVDGETAVLTARAWRPYVFYQWDDGVVENPRRVVVTQDTAFTALFTDPVGIATADSGSVRLQPNPASGSVVVMSSYGIERVEVYDTRGRRVHEQAANGTTTGFDVSDWAKGAYAVVVYTLVGVATKKLLVER